MDKYKYVKAPPGYTLKHPPSISENIKKIFFILVIILGLTSITTVAYPLISYQVFYAPTFAKNTLISPIAENENSVTADLIQSPLDYTDSNTWFTGKPSSKSHNLGKSVYQVSIPRLGIEGAIVRTDSTDLKKSLIQYQDTSYPGNYGSPVIFGHSVLPQYFDPENYVSIFSTLHKLKIGDEILVDYDGIEYRYIIQDMYEVLPTNLSPLNQNNNVKGLKLITCTPPGTYLRRLVVDARLI